MKFCKTFYFLFAIFICTFILNFNVSAKTTIKESAPDSFKVSRSNSKLLHGYDYIDGIKLSFFMKRTLDNKLVYCIERTDEFTKTTEKYNISSKKVDAGITYILRNGYPNKSITGDNDKDYYITGVAIWYYLEPSSNLWRNFDFKNGTYNGKKNDVVVKVNKLVNSAKKAKLNEELTISIDNSSNELTLNNKTSYYTSKKVVVNLNRDANYTVKVTSGPNGTIITDTNGSVKNKFKNGSAFIIKVPEENISKDETIKIKISASKKINRAYIYNPNNSNYQSVVTLYPITLSTSKSLSFSIDHEEEIKTNVNIYKIDSSSKDQVEGAILVVKDSNGNIKDRWETDGKVHKIDGLSFGTYTLYEEKAPEGYKKNDEEITFTLTKENYKESINFVNKKEVVEKKEKIIKVIKVDELSGEALEGAELVVKDASGVVIDKWTTTTSYHKLEGLSEDETYYLSETKAPAGYNKSDEIIKINLKDNIETIKFTNNTLPENPKTGVEDYIIPVGVVCILSGAFMYLITKKNDFIRF